MQYKTAWVLSHKLREAMATEVKGYKLGGVGKTVEVDGGYFGGYIKPANHKENRRDRRLVRNQNGKRQCVVVIRERDGMVMPSAFKSEAAAHSYIRNHVAAGHRDHGRRRQLAGTTCTAATWSSGSTTRWPTAWTAPARTAPRASSAACAGPRSGTTTTSPASTWPATRRRARGARATAGRATGRRPGRGGAGAGGAAERGLLRVLAACYRKIFHFR